MSKKIAFFIFVFLLFLLKNEIALADSLSSIQVTPAVSEKCFPHNSQGFRQLLFAIQQSSENAFEIKLQENLDLSSATDLGSKDFFQQPDENQMNFNSLTKKISFTSESLQNLSLPQTCYFGSAIDFENLILTAPEIYGQGNALAFRNIQQTGVTNIFGGGDQTCSGTSQLNFQQVSGGSWQIVGGNRQGDFLGDITITINQMTGQITDLIGGNLSGSVAGDIKTIIQSSEITVENFAGGGQGTGELPALVTDDIQNFISGNLPKFSLGNYYGGVVYGETGKIRNQLDGQGQVTGKKFIGGHYKGKIKAANQIAVENHIDSRSFSQGQFYFCGGLLAGGEIYGDIQNTIQAGSYNHGGFETYSGAAGEEVAGLPLTNYEILIPLDIPGLPTKFSALETAYDQLEPAERLNLAKSKTAFFMEGNIKNEILSGCVGKEWIQASGKYGVFVGDTTLILGTFQNQTGGSGLVYSSRWGEASVNPTIIDDNSNTSYGLDIYMSGERTTFATGCFFQGKTRLVCNNALLKSVMGSGGSGVVSGNSETIVNHGKIRSVTGSGGQLFRKYGNSQVTLKDGMIENSISSGSQNNRKTQGDLSLEILGGVIKGQVAASIGFSWSHYVEGNSKIFIGGGLFEKNKSSSKITGTLADQGLIRGDSEVHIEPTADFFIPSGYEISANRAVGTNDTRNQAKGGHSTLTFKTTESLENLNIYGDGSPDIVNLSRDQMEMNIVAPQATFSNIQSFATPVSRTLKCSNQIFLEAREVQLLSGRPAENSLKNNVLNGNKISFEVAGKTKINKIENFTDLKLTEQAEVISEEILNGSQANHDNFPKDHHQFGMVTLGKGAQLQVQQLLAKNLTAEKNSQLHSPAVPQAILLNDLKITEQLCWQQTDFSEPQLVTGAFFGAQLSLPVLKILTGKGLTPENFIGFDHTGKSYCGDSSGSQEVASLVTIIDYQVLSPIGKVTHDLTEAKTDFTDLPLAAFATTKAETKSVIGKIIVPSQTKKRPWLSFVDADVANVEIVDSQGNYETQLVEKWQPLGNYHYQVKVTFIENSLILLNVPDQITFPAQEIGMSERFYPEILGRLEISDKTSIEDWVLSLMVKEISLGNLYYQKNGQAYDLQTTPYQWQGRGDFEKDFVDLWPAEEKIYWEIPSGQQKTGDQKVVLQWQLKRINEK